MKKLLLIILAGMLIAACSTGPSVVIEGTVSGAEGKTIYLESSGMEGIVPLDSARLKDKGVFLFKQKQSDSPEFYRLRMEDKTIHFAIDSTEHITVEAPYQDFATAYQIEGSENNKKIKELTLLQMKLQNEVDDLSDVYRANEITYSVFEDSLENLIDTYKNTVKVNYIYQAPNSSVAYFALFQKLSNSLIFDPLGNREDIKCFAAVATSFNNLYPHSVRSKNLYNMVIKGMRNTRQPQTKTIEIPEDKIMEAGVIDIELRNVKGETRKLSDLKGKAVLLDFNIYQTTVGEAHNFMLTELYEKYALKGLEIYQVSLDTNEHFWKTKASQFPWVCVRDENGIYSQAASLYNVSKVPAMYLINRDNELEEVVENLQDLENKVKALL